MLNDKLEDCRYQKLLTLLAFKDSIAVALALYTCSNVCLLYTSPSPRD